MTDSLKRGRKADAVDPTAPVWNRQTMASELGVSRAQLDRYRGDGVIPSGMTVGQGHIGWRHEDGRAIVDAYFQRTGKPPPGATFGEIWTVMKLEFALSPEYRRHLPAAEALWLAIEQ